MFGLVLEFYWTGPGDPVVVSAMDPDQTAIDGLPGIDPTNAPGSWARGKIVPIHQKTVVNNQTGQPLPAYVCSLLP